MAFIQLFWFMIPAFFDFRANLTAETLALRQQLVVLKWQKPKPRLNKCD